MNDATYSKLISFRRLMGTLREMHETENHEIEITQSAIPIP